MLCYTTSAGWDAVASSCAGAKGYVLWGLHSPGCIASKSASLSGKGRPALHLRSEVSADSVTQLPLWKEFSCCALPVEPSEASRWSLRSRWAVGGAAGSWVLSKGDWTPLKEQAVTGWAAIGLGRSFGSCLTTSGLPFMSALEKSMHLGRLPSRPPLPGSGGSQSGAKMRMGYVTQTSSF